LIGTTISHFEITGRLGEGGMGEVYRATDTRLGREVAIKVLPPAFTEDPERLARFEREAQLLAALNHQNIAAIYGLEKAEAQQFLVLELVEGDTLQERLARSIPTDEAIEYGRQIAQALEVAHEAGIIHRDLKPANIKITPQGQIKVLDFGLAKAWGPSGSEVEVSESPTLTAQMTQAGVILGTAAYMSPEQARGEMVDKRADIWSFGCVLYEMLTGRQSFSGRTVTDILAAVVKEQPDLSLLSGEVPRRVARLIERCLEKNANDRLRDIGDARIELAPGQSTATSSQIEAAPAALAKPTHHREAASWILSALLLAVLGWVMFGSDQTPTETAPSGVTRFTIEQPGVDVTAGNFNQPLLGIAPGGKHLLYRASTESGSTLVLRSMDRLEGVHVPDSQDGMEPTFSPDGESFAFTQWNRAIKIASVRGMVPTEVAPVGFSRGLSWGDDGNIVYAPGFESGLWQVNPDGGEPREVTRPSEAASEKSHRFPEILPGSATALFTVLTSETHSIDQAQIDAVDLESGERKLVLRSASFPKYLAEGRLLFIRGDQVLSVPFDAEKVEVTGRPEVVLSGLVTMPLAGAAAMATSPDGHLAYVAGGPLAFQLALVRVRLDGGQEALNAPVHPYQSMSLSPDGNSLAVGIDAPTQSIWKLDLNRGTLTRLTLAWGHNDPRWAPDGQSLIATSGRRGISNLYRVPADGSGASVKATTDPAGQMFGDWSPDGSAIVYIQEGDIYTIKAEGGEPTLVVTSPFPKWRPTISPNGRWLAYSSNESGHAEVYVQPLDVPGNKIRISSEGGAVPNWHPNGRELYFLQHGDPRSLMSVTIGQGEKLEVGTPKRLLDYPTQQIYYDIFPNGDIVTTVDQTPDVSSMPLVVVRNWIEELRRNEP
jgi:serine/threonine-protein kinase